MLFGKRNSKHFVFEMFSKTTWHFLKLVLTQLADVRN